MKHAFALIFILWSLGIPAEAQSRKSDREHDGFFGSVRRVVEEGTKLTGTREKPIAGARYRLEARTYDLDGNLVERIVYGGASGKEIIERSVYSSDSDGNRIEKSYSSGSGIPAPTNSQPALLKGDRAADGSYLYKIIYKHDDKGNRVEENVHRGGGAFVYQVQYEYNLNGQVIKRRVKQADGTVDKVSYSYLNAIVTPLSETRSGGETIKYIYSLDHQGNWTLRVGYKDKKRGSEVGEATYRTITYDDATNLVKGAGANGPPLNVMKPVPINFPTPRYSELAKANLVQGTVILRVLVGENGLVKQAIVKKGLPDGLNEEAIIAASKLKFNPARLFGRPIPFWQSVMIEFKLK